MSNAKPEEVKTAPVAEPQTERKDKAENNKQIEDSDNLSDDDCKEHDEETGVCAAMEPCTLPWPGDRKPQIEQDDDGIWSEKEEGDTGISAGSQDMSEKQSQGEEGWIGNKSKWRESMPEGERWRSDEFRLGEDKGGGSLADDEDEGDEDVEVDWKAEKGVPEFTPQVTIVRISSKDLQEEQERPLFEETDGYTEPYAKEGSAQMYHEWPPQDDKIYLCEDSCGERLKLILSTVAGALLFPLLVWGGYELLPFESPPLNSAPLRVVYTLRCSMFAMIPILLGVLVQGVARLRFSSLRPLYAGREEHRLVAVHGHFVHESVGLFLFYFLQLAVMATYISQDLVKLVPLLTIIFAFGRLIYWLCLSLRSAIRGFGFSFSFAPVIVMLGVNLYYVCSSMGPGSVFDVASPTQAPPRQRSWFG
uniref:Transmembrane protein 79a n=1 Tax=Neogobius melanostomus TaxID=47308 RepID=A0A8C6S360_9GOBI